MMFWFFPMLFIGEPIYRVLSYRHAEVISHAKVLRFVASTSRRLGFCTSTLRQQRGTAVVLADWPESSRINRFGRINPISRTNQINQWTESIKSIETIESIIRNNRINQFGWGHRACALGLWAIARLPETCSLAWTPETCYLAWTPDACSVAWIPRTCSRHMYIPIKPPVGW